jgi:hypothetical protein
VRGAPSAPATQSDVLGLAGASRREPAPEALYAPVAIGCAGSVIQLDQEPT